jgi:hypothetical protein
MKVEEQIGIYTGNVMSRARLLWYLRFEVFILNIHDITGIYTNLFFNLHFQGLRSEIFRAQVFPGFAYELYKWISCLTVIIYFSSKISYSYIKIVQS